MPDWGQGSAEFLPIDCCEISRMKRRTEFRASRILAEEGRKAMQKDMEAIEQSEGLLAEEGLQR